MPMNLKQGRALAVVALAVVLAVVFVQRRGAGDAQAGDAHADYRIPSNAEAFRFGSLEFKACELSRAHSAATTQAYCAPFRVPENRTDPNSRRIDLRMALIPAAQAAEDDFIVYLAGGPGQSAVETWPTMAPSLAAASKHRHVLLLDQRGTGESNALKCPSDEAPEELPDLDLVRLRAVTRECLAAVSTHADPRFYTTSDAVEDLETLRQSLGSPKLDLVGVSYGTRVAQQYLRRHPEGVRSIVLDSAVPNSLVLVGDFARNLDDALKAQFAYCAKTPACAKAFPDPMASLQRLRERLRAEPRTVRFADPVDFHASTEKLDEYRLAGLVRLFAYSPEMAALIPHTIEQALAGNFQPLMGQIGLLNRGVEDLVGNGMQLSVLCAEDADLLKPADVAADSVLGNKLVEASLAQCEVWPRGTRPPDFHTPASGDVPTLVLAGEFDPVTPPRYGEAIVQSLGNARLLLGKGQGHNLIGRGCIPKLVGEFMDTLAPKTLDASCVEALGPTPHFIDFNGAAP